MWHWLAVIFALVALYHWKRILAMAHWHSAAWVANIALVVITGGMFALAYWLVSTWGVWGAAITAGLFTAFMIAVRVYTGLWAWQDDDDVIDLE